MQATQQIEGYDSFEQIALGGMAAVYKARKVSLDKPVAIKVLFPHLAQDAVYIERFKREARTAARVQHDNIVNVIDYGESDGSHYIVMEYYDGVTLEELLEEQPVIPLDICFSVVHQVCSGLEAAHASSLVHRDIKPANIIFTRTGGVKLADFGLAKSVGKLKEVTQHGKIIGTPAYMSPEQTRGDDVGTQSDIFSIGVVAYELVCGVRPFEGRNYAEVVDKIQTAGFQPVPGLNPLVDEAFVEVIESMLAKDVKKRYLHVAEAVLDLEEAIDKVGYKRGRRTLASYLDNPSKYLDSFRRESLKKLRSHRPAPDDGVRDAVTHFRRILYLDPSDEAAREELKKLGGAELGTGDADELDNEKSAATASPSGAAEAVPEVIIDDPDSDYRVFLDSIDLGKETPPSFALKLSMRIHSPLPRIMALVKNMPAMIGGRLPLEKAKKLAKVIHELGGVARIEVHPVNESTGSHGPSRRGPEPERADPEPESVRPEPEPLTAGESSAVFNLHPRGKESGPAGGKRRSCQEKTVEHHPINERPADTIAAKPAPTRTCPKCGWEEDVDAKFCSICLYNFNKTEPLDLAAIHSGGEAENPLAGSRRVPKMPTPSVADRLRDLPTSVKIGGLAGLIILLLLIVFGR